MRKLLFCLLLLPIFVRAGSLRISQDYNGDVGTIVLHPTQPILFDTSTWQAIQDISGPLSWDHDIGPGANRLIVVGCGVGGAPDTISSMTIGGFELTKATETADGITDLRTYIYYYVAPPVGLQGLSVFTSSGVGFRIQCGAVSFTGVNQTTPIGFSTGTVRYPGGTNASTSTLTTSVPREVLFDIVNQQNPGTLTAASGQTSQFDGNGGSAFFTIGISTKTTGIPGTYHMGWTMTDSVHITNSVSIRPSP